MNNSIFYFLHSFALMYPWLDSLIIFLANKLIYIMCALGIVFMLGYYDVVGIKSFINLLRTRFKSAISIPLTVLIAWGIADILKHIFHTDRPFIALTNVHSLFPETGFAFPSGHSTAIAALACAIYFRNKGWGTVFIISAVLIGLARVVAGVHFPLDIVGGYLIGFMVAFLSKTL